MLLHEPHDVVDVERRQAEPRRDRARELRAPLAVILAVALADVVEEDREEERRRTRHLCGGAARERQLVGEVAARLLDGLSRDPGAPATVVLLGAADRPMLADPAPDAPHLRVVQTPADARGAEFRQAIDRFL